MLCKEKRGTIAIFRLVIQVNLFKLVFFNVKITKQHNNKLFYSFILESSNKIYVKFENDNSSLENIKNKLE